MAVFMSSSLSKVVAIPVPENCSISSTSPFSNWVEVFSYGITYGYQWTSGATLKVSERRSWLTITARDSRDALARSLTASTSTSRRFKRSAAMSPVEPAPMTSTSQSVANAVASQATPTGGVSTKSCSTPSGAPY